MNCKNLRVRTHKNKKYIYCIFLKKEINFDECKYCEFKEYKSYKKLESKKEYKYTSKKHKLTKEVDIPQKVKEKVWERDNHSCVVCGNTYNVMPNAHILARSHGGLGIETNVVTLCTNLTENKCHHKFDNGTLEEKQYIYNKIENHMKRIYGDSWNINNQKYKK